MQSPGIGREAGYIGGLLAVDTLRTRAVRVITVVICHIRADRGPKMKRCGGASAAGVLPLGFTGEGIAAAGALAEAMAKFHCI